MERAGAEAPGVELRLRRAVQVRAVRAIDRGADRSPVREGGRLARRALEHGTARRAAARALGRSGAARTAHEHPRRVGLGLPAALELEAAVPTAAQAHVLAAAPAAGERAEPDDAEDEQHEPDDVHGYRPAVARIARAIAWISSTSSRAASPSLAYGLSRVAIVA